MAAARAVAARAGEVVAEAAAAGVAAAALAVAEEGWAAAVARAAMVVVSSIRRLRRLARSMPTANGPVD